MEYVQLFLIAAYVTSSYNMIGRCFAVCDVQLVDLYISCWPGLHEYRFSVCRCLKAVSLAIFFFFSMIYGVYITVIYHSVRDDFLCSSVDIETYMRLDLLLGSAKGCLDSTCISLCASWNGVTLSLSLSPDGSHHLNSQAGWNLIAFCSVLGLRTWSRKGVFERRSKQY